MTTPGKLHAQPIRQLRAVLRACMGLAVAVFATAWPPMTAHAQSAPAATWPAVVAAAKKEGRVMLYWGGTPQALNRVAAGFKAAYPDIAIEFFRATGGALMTRIDQERSAGLDGADVWVGGEAQWALARDKEGRLLKPAGPATQNLPARFMLAATVPIVGIEPFLIAYNKTLVAAAPTSYADLLKPEFKGKLGMSELSSTALVAFYDWLEKTQGTDFLAKLRAQNARVSGNVVTLAQSVASGEFAAAVTGILTATKPLVDAGAPIAYTLANPGFGTSYIVSAMGWSQRPNAALVLLDYIASADGQNAWHGKGEGVSILPGVQGAALASTITTWNANDYPPEFVTKYRERWTAALR